MTPDNPLIENKRMELLKFEGTLTKRETFAMAAMQGICRSENWNGDISDAAKDAVTLADALIDALKSIPEPK